MRFWMNELPFVRGRKGSAKPPLKKEMDGIMDCPVCGKEGLTKYPDGTLAKHKVYVLDSKGKKTSKWKWCEKTRWR